MEAMTIPVMSSRITLAIDLQHPLDIFLKAQLYLTKEPIEVAVAPMMKELRGIFPFLVFMIM